jgi:hypothetical protein
MTMTRENIMPASKRMRTLGIATLALCALNVSSWQRAEAQLTRVRPAAETASERPAWHGTMAGWQIGGWGAPGAHIWRIERDGRGSIILPGRPRTGGARPVEQRFSLTVAEHVRFAQLIEQFINGPQNTDLCVTDQAQDIVRWNGGTRSDGLFNFDHGCDDAANIARLALLTDALTILRTASARQTSRDTTRDTRG